MPYLDKEKQRKFVREWMAKRRRETLAAFAISKDNNG